MQHVESAHRDIGSWVLDLAKVPGVGLGPVFLV